MADDKKQLTGNPWIDELITEWNTEMSSKKNDQPALPEGLQDDETKKKEAQEKEWLRMKEFFFGEVGKKLPKVFVVDQEYCYHDWIEVTLFMQSELRCKHCDIRKRVYDIKKESK